jgi:hypothetical protein
MLCLRLQTVVVLAFMPTESVRTTSSNSESADDVKSTPFRGLVDNDWKKVVADGTSHSSIFLYREFLYQRSGLGGFLYN